MIHGDALPVLEAHYRHVLETRMQGMPVINPELAVKAVGFSDWQGHRLGVMVTPWFMNLMLLPAEADEWKELQPGDKQRHQLTSGPYEFVLGEDEGIGRYQSCSLFSPMFDFADQETAVKTAEAVMEALMREENRDTVSTREAEIERIWRGEPETKEPAEAEVAGPTLSEKMETPMTRRELLRGAFLRGTE